MQNILVNYVEFKAKDLEATKQFYSQLFGWKFTDYGPTYTSFSESGLAGGFEETKDSITNGALIVLYHTELVDLKDAIVENGGEISKDIFAFPGGKRFHFKDPSGNELAVWTDK